MIEGEYFKGDNDNILKNIQFDLYWKLVSELFLKPKEKFLKSAELLKFNPELIEKINKIDSIDHRIYQNAHDIIANYYRYAYHDLIKNNMNISLAINDYDDRSYPELVDCLQLDLFKKTKVYLNCVEQNWFHFYNKEIFYLTNFDNLFVRASIIAALNQNKAICTKAEEVIACILYDRYNCLDWYHNNDQESRKEFIEFYQLISTKQTNFSEFIKIINESN